MPDSRSSSLPGLGPETGAPGGGGGGEDGVVGAWASAEAGRARQSRRARATRRTAPGSLRYATAAAVLRTMGVRTAARIASETIMSSGICQVQPWVTPNASELLSECSAMHGSSDPVLA